MDSTTQILRETSNAPISLAAVCHEPLSEHYISRVHVVSS